MPRSGRGGRRTGKVGAPYSNRSDLRDPKVPIAAATGQPYGAAAAQRAAQQAVPVAGAPMIAPGAAQAPGGTPQGQAPPVSPALAGLLTGGALPPGVPAPGTLPPLDAPTDRPDEHLMTGVDAGPGPGSEALSPMIVHPLVAAAGALNALGSAASPQVKTVRDVINAQLSNQGTP